MNDKYINDIEPIIINWLKSGNENTTHLAYLISEYIRNEIKLINERGNSVAFCPYYEKLNDWCEKKKTQNPCCINCEHNLK